MYCKIEADYENNATLFWASFRETMPRVSEAMERDGVVVVSESGWAAIQKIQGFADGPAHARAALVECGDTDTTGLDAWHLLSSEDSGSVWCTLSEMTIAARAIFAE